MSSKCYRCLISVTSFLDCVFGKEEGEEIKIICNDASPESTVDKRLMRYMRYGSVGAGAGQAMTNESVCVCVCVCVFLQSLALLHESD